MAGGGEDISDPNHLKYDGTAKILIIDKKEAPIKTNRLFQWSGLVYGWRYKKIPDISRGIGLNFFVAPILTESIFLLEFARGHRLFDEFAVRVNDGNYRCQPVWMSNISAIVASEKGYIKWFKAEMAKPLAQLWMSGGRRKPYKAFENQSLTKPLWDYGPSV